MIKKGILAWLCVLLIASGCSKQSDLSKLLKEIDAITIPEEVEIVSLGEASHGNKEFHEMKLDVFKQLVENEGFRAFALEADFGASQVVNDYILNDIGSAREGLEAIGFYIYMTEEMIELIEWMHDYNENTSDKLYFYGFDMQLFNHSKQRLLDYLAIIQPENLASLTEQLLPLRDDTEITSESAIQAQISVEAIIADLQAKEEAYTALTNKRDYAFALEYANSLLENIDLWSNPESGNAIRDPYMAKKTEWISNFEKSEGRNRLFICGHNGHIAKSEQMLNMKNMGTLISETYGERYFAIGTEFHKSTFLSKDGATEDYELKTFKISNETSELVKKLSECNVDQAYLDFSEAMQVESLNALLNDTHYMGTTGAVFMKGYQMLLTAFAIPVVPAKNYDALIFVESASPTVMLPEEE